MNSTTDNYDREEEIIKLEEKVLELKKENRALKLQVTENDQAKKHVNDKENEELMTLKKSNEEYELKISELSTKMQEMEEKSSLQTAEHEMEKQQINEKHTAELNGLRETLNEKCNELDTLQQNVKSSQGSNNNNSSNNGELIRGIMNQFYVKLYQSIEGQETMSTAEILKITAEIIRKETKAALNSN